MELMAHRGASGIAPENTLAAFALCLDFEPDWIELDVHATADGAIVVMHDDTVDRTTDGPGAIGAMTLAEFQALDAGSWHSAPYAGEHPPTLRQVVELVGTRVRLDVEIKGCARTRGRGPNLAHVAREVVAILDAGGILARSMISSFDLNALLAVAAITDVPALALITGKAADLQLVQAHGLSWLNLYYGDLSSTHAEAAHAAGVRVCGWTINDLGRWDEFCALGLDVLCTDMCHQAPPRQDR